MASNTSNLGLLKKDPLTDGKDTFNIRTMLNDNWDKIDEFAGKTIPISRGGTGATTAEQALSNLGAAAVSAVGNLHVWQRVQSGVTDYLTSTDMDAYTDGTVDSTTITYLGQLGGGARIEVGSYVGTGNFSVSINVNKNAKFIVISSGGIIGFFVPKDETFSSFTVNSRYLDRYTSFNAKMINGTLSWSGSQQNNYSDELYLCSSGVTFYVFTIC